MASSLIHSIQHILQKSQIESKSDWIKLIKGLLSSKILSFSEQRIVDPNILEFPITAIDAQRIIIQSKSNSDMVSIVLKIKKLKEMLRDITDMVEQWKSFGLTKEESIALQQIMKNINQKIQIILNELQKFLSQSKSIDENFIQTVQKLSEGFEIIQEIEAEEYQQRKYIELEDYFNQIKVRDVVDRSKPTNKVLDPKQIHTYVALNKIDYRPVQVTKIAKAYNNYKKMEEILNTFDALRQMSFSPYFQKYYGYSDSSIDPTHHYYFTQVIQGYSLKDLLTSTHYHLLEDTPIYQHWYRQLFFALYDLYYKTTYMPILPVHLDNIFIYQKGIGLKLKGVRFNRVRRQNENRGLLEAKLLRNYGLLCLQIIGLSESEIEKVNKVSLKMLLRGLLRSQFEQVRFDEGSSAKRLSFKLCKNFSLLTKQFVIDANGEAISKNFEDIFKK